MLRYLNLLCPEHHEMKYLAQKVLLCAGKSVCKPIRIGNQIKKFKVTVNKFSINRTNRKAIQAIKWLLLHLLRLVDALFMNRTERIF